MSVEVREIAPEAWADLASIFRDECGSDLPLAEFGTFYGVYEDGHLKGFVLAEQITMIGQIFTVGDGKMEYVKAMIDHLQAEYPPGISVGSVATEPRFIKLFESLGMNRMPGVFFRRN